MIRFEDIVEKVEGYDPEADISFLRKAYIFSAKEHRGQVRLSGEPYLTHPLEVAYILADLKLDISCVASGLLHDILEDTNMTLKALHDAFGKDIAHIVNGVTKIGEIEKYRTKEEMEAENLRKMILAMVDDLRVILVKLADRLHNMRTLQYLAPERRERISRETFEIYAPIAHRLGIGKIKDELEELALKHQDTAAYEELIRNIENSKRISSLFIEEISRTLRQTFSEQNIPVEIHGRIKSPYSIHRKMKDQQITFDQIYDLVAFRIITRTVRDCYAILGIMHSIWKPVPGRFKDFIAMPKPNMYQSLHTSVITQNGETFEVQIRTEDMHRIAEEGVAAHWRYKEKAKLRERDLTNVQWLRQLMEWQQEVKDPREFLKVVKVDLYPDEVYAFTPKGKILSFPKGATPIDFAYAIHTDVGHQCVGARINGKLVPLRTLLQSGDRVEIITSAGHRPSRDWLNIATTSRAKNKIRSYLIASERNKSITLGREICEKEFKKYRMDLKKLSGEDENLEKALEFLGFRSLDDFFVAVGLGKVTAHHLVSRLVPPEKLKEREGREFAISKVVKKVLGLGDKRVKVKGMGDVMVYLAKCCNPIMGEEIVGYITRGKGVSVHSVSCHNVEKLLYDSERRIAVEWERREETIYEVRLRIQMDDRQGILAKIVSAISDERTNIRDLGAKSLEEKRGEINLVLDIHDMEHLSRIMKRIEGVKGVHNVERI
ncbi:MAG: bifunctional (p)ppGpp synthetase/guanosine-3',5'-bis(diphosphate) 3'-pyrophosphohydrolase [Acidobacteriota bacterium]